MTTFLCILLGAIIICDVLVLIAPKAHKPVTEEEYAEFKKYMKKYEGNRPCRWKRNKASSNN